MDDESPLITTLFRVRLLTAQRGGEVHGAAWAEFDLRTGWWTIPADRSKNGLAHRVRLSPQAVRILKTWRASAGDSPWVFPSSRKNRPRIAHAHKAIEQIVGRSHPGGTCQGRARDGREGVCGEGANGESECPAGAQSEAQSHAGDVQSFLEAVPPALELVPYRGIEAPPCRLTDPSSPS
jgi:integrase